MIYLSQKKIDLPEIFKKWILEEKQKETPKKNYFC
jgi:hypothetical protein